MQLAVHRARVVPGRDPPRVDRVGLHEQVAELRERVAAHARNRRASVRVLVHEIVDDVATERALEIEHVVRNAERLTDAPRVVHRVERAARAIGQIVVVAEELHRRADDVVALLDEHRRGDGRIDAAGHGDQHALLHRARSARPHGGRSSARLVHERRKHLGDAVDARVGREAADAHANRRSPRSRSDTPIALSTCDGVMLPL